MNSKFPGATLAAVIIFSVAMAFWEASVVIYLRELYYPNGFVFPLRIMPANIYNIELVREAATIVMLAAIGWLSAKSFMSRFACFMIAFGIWDIFYYVFLKVTLNWPANILQWDILFLIPLPWVGPVLAPVIISFLLIGTGIYVLFRESGQNLIIITKWRWALFALSALVIIGSFLTNTKAMINQTVPTSFHWEIFTIGLLLGIGGFTKAIDRNLKNEN